MLIGEFLLPPGFMPFRVEGQDEGIKSKALHFLISPHPNPAWPEPNMSLAKIAKKTEVG